MLFRTEAASDGWDCLEEVIGDPPVCSEGRYRACLAKHARLGIAIGVGEYCPLLYLAGKSERKTKGTAVFSTMCNEAQKLNDPPHVHVAKMCNACPEGTNVHPHVETIAQHSTVMRNAARFDASDQ